MEERFAECTAQGDQPAANLILTPERIAEFLRWSKSRQRAAMTLERYQGDLMQLYQWLPEDKTISAVRLRQWRRLLRENGYAERSINSKISAINSYLAFEGKRELQMMDFEKSQRSDVTITRKEYLRLLKAAKAMNNQKLYLLVKLFGTAGLPIRHLSAVTVEAAENGVVKTDDGAFELPAGLRAELLHYAKEQHLDAGPVFRTRRGGPLSRTTAASMMKCLSGPSGVDEEKITSRCLRKMYQDNRDAFLQDVEYLAKQAYAKLLEREQQKAGWDQGR